MANLFIFNLQINQIFLTHPSKRNQFGIRSCYYQPQKPAFLLNISQPCSNVALYSIFCTNFFWTHFPNQNKNNVIETISCFVDQLSKKYCLYYASEHLKYNNKCWLNKNVCLNIVQQSIFRQYKYQLDFKIQFFKLDVSASVYQF